MRERSHRCTDEEEEVQVHSTDFNNTLACTSAYSFANDSRVKHHPSITAQQKLLTIVYNVLKDTLSSF
jgi:hypothetical protein